MADQVTSFGSNITADESTLTKSSSQVMSMKDAGTTSAKMGFELMEVVASSVLTGTASAITISDLDLDTDRHYLILLDAISSGTAGWDNIVMTVNADTTATNYAHQSFQASHTTLTGNRANNGTIASLYTAIPFSYRIRLSKYTGKIAQATSRGTSRADVSNITLFDFSWMWTGTANITSITLTNSEDFAAGTKVTVLKVG